MRRAGLAGVLCVAACSAGQAPAPSGQAGKPASAPRPRAKSLGPAEVLAYRFVDHAAEARVEGDLAFAWRAIKRHPQRALLPYAALPGDAVYRAVQMAFADPDLQRYAAGDDAPPPRPAPAVAAAKVVRTPDEIWNRHRAVYLSRQALFVPASSAQTYRVRLPAGARLVTSLGLLCASGRAARFRVTVDDSPVLDEIVDRPEAWRDKTIDLGGALRTREGREVTIRFAVDEVVLVRTGPPPPLDPEAPEGVSGFFANPLLYGRGERPAPNVLFILVDTLRADATAVMPKLNAWAARGARFDQAVTAATWTRPSMLAMYGGDLPSAVGQSAEQILVRDGDRRRFYRLAPPLLPRLLGARGLRTAAIGNNFFLLGYPAIGLDLGFEEVDDVRHPVEDTPAITRAAIRFLTENRDRPFFLHIHYDAPHWPYTPPLPYRVPSKVAGWKGDAALQKDPLFLRYLGEAAYADDNVAEVLDALEKLGLAGRTLVIVVGDHGEVFDPAHDQIVEALRLPTLHHHGWSAWDEVLRVPLAIGGLGGEVAARAVPQQVRLYDLAPTILDYLDVPGDLLPARGRSLRPLVEGRETGDRIAFAEGQNVRAVRDGGWLYLRRDDGHLRIRNEDTVIVEELYDLARDPGQHENLAGRAPEALARMRALFAREAPTPPEAPQTVYHLRLAADGRPHRLDGTIAVVAAAVPGAAEGAAGLAAVTGSNPPAGPAKPAAPPPPAGRIAVRGVDGGSVAALDERTIRIDVHGPGGVDFVVDPPDAPLVIQLRKDGVPLTRRHLLAGEFALPVLTDDSNAPNGDGPPRIAGPLLDRLDARRPPDPGARGDVLLYRDPGARAEVAAQGPAESDADEVSGMMQRWGYAQPEAKGKPEGGEGER